MKNIKNLTDEDLVYFSQNGKEITIKKEPNAAMLLIKKETFGLIALDEETSVTLTGRTKEYVINLPEPQEGVYLIVERSIKEFYRGKRTDLVTALKNVFDEEHNIIGFTELEA